MSQKQTILFIINNLSGTVREYNIPKCIEMFLDKEKYEVSTFFIENGIDNNAYLSKINESWDIIISVGGDGTLLEIGQLIIDRNVVLGIIPIGSGNGLATHIGYKPRDIEGAFRAINHLNIKAIDVAKLGKEYFFSNFGIGIDSVVARDFKMKKKRSLITYSYLTIKRLFGIRAHTIRYKTATEEREVQSFLFNVFNSNLFGYNVGLLPWASAFDGKLNVVYLQKCNILSLAWAGLCIMIKRPNWSKNIHFFETESITIINQGKIDYQIDGDPKSIEGEIRIEVLPSKLKMIIP